MTPDPSNPPKDAPRIVLEVLKLDKLAVMPSYAHEGDSGLDLYSIYPVWITGKLPVLVETGWAMKLPPGYEGQIRPRSGLSARGYNVSFGTIDNGYRGHVKVCISHVDPQPLSTLLWEKGIYQDVTDAVVRPPDFEAGSKIAQLVLNPFVPAHLIEIVEVTSFSDTSRGDKGFGSSGV